MTDTPLVRAVPLRGVVVSRADIERANDRERARRRRGASSSTQARPKTWRRFCPREVRLGSNPDGSPRTEQDVDSARVAAGRVRVHAAAEEQGYRDGWAGRSERRLFTDVPRHLLGAWRRGQVRGLADRRARLAISNPDHVAPDVPTIATRTESADPPRLRA